MTLQEHITAREMAKPRPYYVRGEGTLWAEPIRDLPSETQPVVLLALSLEFASWYAATWNSSK